ncbi:hypothetical protein GT044_22670, partial [Streptomyces sp. SID335]|nr:hypothetical protein [Streptomyces sp. SID335]
TADLDGSLGEADAGLQVTAVAAYFADALRTAAPPGGHVDRDLPEPNATTPNAATPNPASRAPVTPIPAAPSFAELSERAHALPTRTKQVRELTSSIDQAARLAAG